LGEGSKAAEAGKAVSMGKATAAEERGKSSDAPGKDNH